jgi:hypothetical protein
MWWNLVFLDLINKYRSVEGISTFRKFGQQLEMSNKFFTTSKGPSIKKRPVSNGSVRSESSDTPFSAILSLTTCHLCKTPHIFEMSYSKTKSLIQIIEHNRIYCVFSFRVIDCSLVWEKIVLHKNVLEITWKFVFIYSATTYIQDVKMFFSVTFCKWVAVLNSLFPTVNYLTWSSAICLKNTITAVPFKPTWEGGMPVYLFL